jgi:hypothetical protein
MLLSFSMNVCFAKPAEWFLRFIIITSVKPIAVTYFSKPDFTL